MKYWAMFQLQPTSTIQPSSVQYAFRPYPSFTFLPCYRSLTAPQKRILDGEDSMHGVENESSPELLSASWYPTLTRTLSSLAKLYLSVDGPIFEELAHEVRPPLYL